MELKKKEKPPHRNRVEWWLPGAGDCEKRVKEYELPFIRRRSSEDLSYSMAMIVNNIVLCAWKLLKIVSVLTTKKKCNYIIILLQYKSLTNQHVVHFKLTQCYMPDILIKLEKIVWVHSFKRIMLNIKFLWHLVYKLHVFKVI